MKFDTNIDLPTIASMVKAHVRLQIGCYFSDSIHTGCGDVATSEIIEDHYWNSVSGFPDGTLHSLQEVIAPVFAAKRRKLAFYLDPSTAADQFVAQLEHGSFVFEPEVWLVAERDSLKQRPQSPVTVVPVNERNEADFLRVFSVAFGGPSTAKDGYGDIPPEYLSALRLSFSGQQTLAGVRHSHFIAYKGSTPVGCASIHHDGEFAGLYNVGTLAEARGSGIGSALSLHAMTLAFENGVTQVFLQTQSGGSVERFYQHLGCTVAFQAAIAHKA